MAQPTTVTINKNSSDLLQLLQEVAGENNWPLSVATDESYTLASKNLARFNLFLWPQEFLLRGW